MQVASQKTKPRIIMQDMTFPNKKIGKKFVGKKTSATRGVFLFSKFYAILLVLVLSAIVVPLAAFEAHVVNVTATIERPCVEFEVRSTGYWRTHEENWILPQTLGAEVISTPEEAAAIFDLDQSTAENRLKKQLLALKFNIAYFDAGSGFAPYQSITLNQLAAEADTLLLQDPPVSNLALNTMKDRVEAVNVAGFVSTCSAPDPQMIYELCFDEMDNDGDGLIDFEDDDCDIFLPEIEEQSVEGSQVLGDQSEGEGGAESDGDDDGEEDNSDVDEPDDDGNEPEPEPPALSEVEGEPETSPEE